MKYLCDAMFYSNISMALLSIYSRTLLYIYYKKEKSSLLHISPNEKSAGVALQPVRHNHVTSNEFINKINELFTSVG